MEYLLLYVIGLVYFHFNTKNKVDYYVFKFLLDHLINNCFIYGPLTKKSMNGLEGAHTESLHIFITLGELAHFSTRYTASFHGPLAKFYTLQILFYFLVCKNLPSRQPKEAKDGNF